MDGGRWQTHLSCLMRTARTGLVKVNSSTSLSLASRDSRASSQISTEAKQRCSQNQVLVINLERHLAADLLCQLQIKVAKFLMLIWTQQNIRMLYKVFVKWAYFWSYCSNIYISVVFNNKLSKTDMLFQWVFFHTEEALFMLLFHSRDYLLTLCH